MSGYVEMAREVLAAMGAGPEIEAKPDLEPAAPSLKGQAVELSEHGQQVRLSFLIETLRQADVFVIGTDGLAQRGCHCCGMAESK